MTVSFQTKKRHAVTLIELTVVIAVIAVLVGISVASIDGYRDWEKSVRAGEQLQSVYAAQRLFLSDFPTRDVDSIREADIIPYLPDRTGALPVVEDLDKMPLGFDLTVSPPTLTQGGIAYDPTPPNDGRWDTGR